VTALEVPTGTDIRPGRVRARARGCNPPRAPKHAPDTPWGRLRTEQGWSIRELAERTGINRGDLSKIERGLGCATPDQARRLLVAYDGAG
jgi:hypothetical protein